MNCHHAADNCATTLTMARRLAALRMRTPALQVGSQRAVHLGVDVLAWMRDDGSDRLLVAINFATVPVRCRDTTGLLRSATLVLSSDPRRGEGEVDLRNLELAPSEAAVTRMR